MNSGRLIFGIIVIIIGVLFLLDNVATQFNLGGLTQWWPSLLVLLGIWWLISNKFRRLFMPLALIVVGVLLQLSQLDIGIDFWDYWPLILIAVGIAILAGSMRRRNRRHRNSSTSHNASPIIDVDVSAYEDADDATLHAVVGSQDRTISGDFHSASINVVMGSGSLDLRNARIVNKPATLEASVVMGEVKVRVPNEWNIRIANSSQMGDTKDARRSQNNSDTPDLIINGSVTMGSLQITD